MQDTGDYLKPISDRLYELCNSSESVSTVLARDLKITPGEAWKKLYGHDARKPVGRKSSDATSKATSADEVLERAAKCGKWGPTQPSELFLRVSGIPVLNPGHLS